MNLAKPILCALTILVTTILIPNFGTAADFVVYSIYRPLDLGPPNETPQKDVFINMGGAQGLREGSIVEVLRRASTYDLLTEKLYREITFPIGRLKVIHVEQNAAVARIDKYYPSEKTPSISPRAVMVGDLVRLASP